MQRLCSITHLHCAHTKTGASCAEARHDACLSSRQCHSKAHFLAYRHPCVRQAMPPFDLWCCTHRRAVRGVFVSTPTGPQTVHAAHALQQVGRSVHTHGDDTHTARHRPNHQPSLILQASHLTAKYRGACLAMPPPAHSQQCSMLVIEWLLAWCWCCSLLYAECMHQSPRSQPACALRISAQHIFHEQID